MKTLSRIILPAFLIVILIIGCSANGNSETNTENLAQSNMNSEEATFDVYQVVNNLEHPWAMDWLPDGQMVIAERPGRIQLFNGESLREVSGLPSIRAKNQGGLLDVRVHPNFEKNGWIYFTYSSPGEGGTGTALARARLNENETVLADLEVLYTQEPRYRTGRHFGSRIVFPDPNTVVFSIGDRGRRDPAQDLTDPAGSLIRLNANGSIPDDNPFVGQDGVRPEIYTYGHRNPQGIDLHPKTNRIWLHEHGPNGGDELNVIYRGKNYGWPVDTYGTEYSDDSPIGMLPHENSDSRNPIAYWGPTSIAPSGMTFYTGDKFPNWKGNIFLGALAKQHLRRLVLDGESITHQETLLEGTLGRIRAVNQGPDGYLYLLVDSPSASLYRLEPSTDQ